MTCSHAGTQGEPELIEDDGVLRVRSRPCSTCGETRDLEKLPDAVDESARAVLAKVPPGPHRLLDPDLLAVLAPHVAQAFPGYWSRTERWYQEHRPDLAGISAGDRWRLVAWLRGSTGYGQARCVRDDGTHALATFTLRQTAPLEQLAARLRLATPGVAPLLGIGTGGHGGAVMFEAEPAGVPLSTAMFPLPVEPALAVFAQLVSIARDCAGAGEALRGLRPELVYIGRDPTGVSVTGVAPRAEPFARDMVEPRDLAPELPFDASYSAPEIVRGGRGSSASDVFSSCAILLFTMARRSPFGAAGKNLLDQLAAMLKGAPELPAALGPELTQVIRAGLDADPTRRPTATELASALARVGYPAPSPRFVARP